MCYYEPLHVDNPLSRCGWMVVGLGCSVKVEHYSGGIPPESIHKPDRSQLRSQTKSIHTPINHDEATEKEYHTRLAVARIKEHRMAIAVPG